jgi:NAD(P)-dependent dehydrogenase (short-subunit alcohol dehydrogenase family)
VTARGGALVTGAGRGLGLAIARRLAARGHAVHVTDVDADAAERAAAELGGDAWASTLDVRDAAACRAAARATVERAGSLAVWVNNAGILITGHAWEHGETERAALLDVNVSGTVNGTLAALALMRPRDRGHVVNVVSLAGLAAAPGETLYSATKHACLAFSVGTLHDLRRSGSRGVHVSALCPDGIWTPMLYDKLDDPNAVLSFSGVLLDPETVAGKAIELLDRPRPILAVPRWRGAAVRAFAATPRLGIVARPLIMRDARRRQRAWKKKLARSS